MSFFGPFLSNVTILYPLKTLEAFGFLMFLRSYKMGTLARNGLKALQISGRMSPKCAYFYLF